MTSKLAPAPTDAPPGSPEKIAILSWRLAHGFAPHHPDDNRLPILQTLRLEAQQGRTVAGVSRDSAANRKGKVWRARIALSWSGPRHHLGWFSSRDEAEAAVLRARQELAKVLPERIRPNVQRTHCRRCIRERKSCGCQRFEAAIWTRPRWKNMVFLGVFGSVEAAVKAVSVAKGA